MKTFILMILLLSVTTCFSQIVTIYYPIKVTRIDLRVGYKMCNEAEICGSCSLMFVAQWSKDTVLLKYVKDTSIHSGVWGIWPCDFALHDSDYCFMSKLTWNKVLYDGTIQMKKEKEIYQKIIIEMKIDQLRDSLNRIKFLKLINN